MRLINTRTLELEEFIDSSLAPPYAILSHTWEEGEASLQEFANLELASQKKGFSKIDLTCRQARSNGIGYAWVDTCCIDRSSSAELTEAINSMFQWYAGAEVCYAYLSDLPHGGPISLFSKSRWFRRGWTLQELIAPRMVEFYDQSWTFRGTKAQLVSNLERITGISAHVLRMDHIPSPTSQKGWLSGLSVATRMSWAAGRATTRREDMAYCLLGIFNVNMTLLYGEGERAFIRLQEEIIKDTNDLSIFAWRKDATTQQNYHGILAVSPEYFKFSKSVLPILQGFVAEEFAVTNKGLRINTVTYQGEDTLEIMPLYCKDSSLGELGIFLKHHGGRLYSRARVDALPVIGTTGAERDLPLVNRQESPAIIFISKHLSTEPSFTDELNSNDNGE